MVNKYLLLKLIRDLWLRRGVVFAVIMILAAGVCNYSGMAGVYQDLATARDAYYKQYNLADFTLDLKRAPEIVVQHLRLNNVLRLRKRINTTAMVMLPLRVYQDIIKPIPGTIISLPFPKNDIINNVHMVHGTWFSSPYAHEAILDQQFASARNLQVGDRIQVRLPDQQVSLLVVGTVISPEYTSILAPSNLAPDPANQAIVYMPFKLLQQYAELNGSFNQLLGMVNDKSKVAIQNTMALAELKLDNYGVLLKTSQSEEVAVKILHDELVNVQKSITIFPTMFFLVAILILNVMLNRLVAQQHTSIGILKSLGYGNFTLFIHYLSFGAFIGLAGGVLGVVIGFGLQHLMLDQYKLYFAIPNMHLGIYFQVIIVGIGVSVVSAMLGALIATYKVVKLAPANAMRPPAPETGAHIFLEYFTKMWEKLSFYYKLFIRNIFRNRIRSIVTIIASLIATILVFTAFEFIDSIYEMIDFSFNTVQHQDYDLVLRDPLGKDIVRTVTTVPGVKKIESQLSVPAILQNGPFHKNISILGLPKNNKLFTPVAEDNTPIVVSDSGIVINETLANILNVKKNDVITIRPLLGERRLVKIRIADIIRTYLGLAAYAEQTWLSRLLGNSFLANHILFQLYPGADEQKFIKAISEFGEVVNVNSKHAAQKLLRDTFDKFMVFTALIIIIFAAIIAMGSILNTALISLSERQRDVASLRVLGFSNYQVAKMFFLESFWLNCVGVFFGLFGGIYFAYFISSAFSTELYRMPVVIRPLRLFETVFIMLNFIFISQLIVYYVIRKSDWFAILNIRE